jgi:hypothetical protein
MNQNDITRLENLEESELRRRYDRGDYTDHEEIDLVEKLLNTHEKDRKFKEDCEKASFAAPLNAEKRSQRSSIIAVIALLISMASFAWQFICKGG